VRGRDSVNLALAFTLTWQIAKRPAGKGEALAIWPGGRMVMRSAVARETQVRFLSWRRGGPAELGGGAASTTDRSTLIRAAQPPARLGSHAWLRGHTLIDASRDAF
jgi:hypothetical protein